MEAIQALPTEADERIGQAILATTDEFEGKNVDQRKELLASKYGISKNVFKRRRPAVLDYLVTYLDAVRPSGSSLADSTMVRHNLYALIRDVAQLYYGFIVYKFVKDFDKRLRASSSSAFQPPRRNSRALTDTLYNAYLELIWSSGYCRDDASYSCRTMILASVPSELLDALGASLTEIFDAMPFALRNRQALCLDRYGSMQDLRDYRERLDAFRAWWDSWATENLCLEETNASSDQVIAQIMSCCDNILGPIVITAEINIGDTGSIMDRVVRAVADYYGLEPSSPILDGKSLQDYCRPHLERAKIGGYYDLVRLVP
jgi:hypothetical protein